MNNTYSSVVKRNAIFERRNRAESRVCVSLSVAQWTRSSSSCPHGLASV